MCGYLVWMYLDWGTPENGSRWWSWCHPHGILSISAFLNFATNGTGFAEKFPGLQTHLVTLASQFYVPFRRETMTLSGIITSSVKSISNVLKRPGGGQVACIVIGGAEEALDAHSDSFNLCLRSRKGFVRVALQQGASLVPVYSFGENACFQQVSNERGTRLRNIQSRLKKIFGVSPPLFHGRGLLNKYFGLLPYRQPIATIVGSPIHLERTPEPTPERIDEVHAEYVKKLTDLFEEHKEQYGVAADCHLVMC
ncbi:Acyltransferase [Aphelenchoides fujianensis]|nr:Acyltransferase [Aphelenchoides fujianensis]